MMGVVINGKYYKDGEAHAEPDASQYKAWSHSEQRKIHAKELIQPYKNGKPNEEFINAWPEEAKQYGFLPSDDQLKKM